MIGGGGYAHATPASSPVASVQQPTATPAAEPDAAPVVESTAIPAAEPDAAPVVESTATPAAELDAAPVAESTATPVAQPSAAPTGLMDMPVTEAWRRMLSLFIQEEELITEDIDHFKSDITQDLSGFDRLVSDAGYRLTDVAVGAGLIPSVELSFDLERILPPAEKAALLKRLETEQIGRVEGWIVKSLLHAAESPLAKRGDGYSLSGVDIGVEIIPDVTLHLSKSSSGN